MTGTPKPGNVSGNRPVLHPRPTHKNLSKIFEHSNDAVFLIDPHQDEILECNRKACNMLGYSSQELLSLGISSVHPNEMPKLLALTDTIYATGYGWTDQVTCLTKTGDVLPVEISASRAQIRGRSCVIAIVHDITERKRAEEALRESEQRYRSIYQNTPVMMHSLDLKGRLVSVNEYWLKVLGYSYNEVIGRKSVEFLTEASQRYATQVAFPEFFRCGGFARDVQYQFVKKNGEILDVLLSAVAERNESGDIYRLSCFIIDVTDRKQAEQALRESEERYRRLVELSPDAIVVISEGKIVFANPAEAKLIGASSPEELIGISAIRLLHPENKSAVEERLRRIDEEGDASHVNEGKIVRLDGQVRDIEAAGAPIIYEGKKAVQVICRDITERKQAERELQRLALVVSNIGEGVVVTDPDGRIEFINGGFERLLGYEWDELQGKPVSDLYPGGADNPVLREIMKGVLAGGWSGEAELLAKDGKRIPTMETASPIKDAAGRLTGYVCTNTDITARKQAEQAMRESEERYRRLVELSPDAIAVVSERKIVFANPAEATLMGASSPEELIGKLAIETVHPENRPTVEERLRRLSEAGDVSHINDGKLVRLDGQVRYIEAAGAPITYEGKKAVQIISRDITERKQAGEALAYQARLVEGVSDAIIASDEKFVTTAWNRAAEKMYGWTAEEAIGRPTAEFLQPEFVDVEPHEVWRRLLEKGGFEGEVIHPRKDGTRIHTEARAMALRDEDGRVTGFVSIDRDITERKRAEEVLRKAGEELEARVEERTAELRALTRRLQSVREEERTHIAREIHDELGQELTSLKLDLSWVARRLAGTGDGHERSAVSSKIVSMEGTVDSTIASIRKISTQLRPTMLDDLGLMATLEWQAQDFERRTGIACGVTLPEAEETLGRDQTTALFRICQESLTNVARHARATRVSVAVMLIDGDAVLTVADDGRGISEREAVGGRSLGLLGMRERALALGGRVNIVGTPGHGTVVTARIPLAEPTSVGDGDKTEVARV